jgi:type I protein arginine methyltransferase
VEYSLADYGSMIADHVRMNAYVRALQSAVSPGSFVLELGTGPGLIALLARRQGARRVVAVEPHEVIEVAREIARANRLDGAVEFRQSFSKELELDERADVIVSDLRGILPFHTGHIESIVDARERLLVPGGTMIPSRDRLWGAVVTDPDMYEKRIGVWSEHGRKFDLGAARELAVNTWWGHRVDDSHVLTEHRLLATLDYGTIDSPDLEAEATLSVERAGAAHGICVWFDTELVQGEGFSNAPGQPEAIYGQAFFPLAEPVDVETGDALWIRMRAKLAGGDYVWGWSTAVTRDGVTVTEFRQTTALGLPLTRRLLERSAEGFVPVLSEEGEAVKLCLESMDGEHSLREIANRFSAHSTRLFERGGDSLQFVVRVAQKYSR